MIRGIALLGEVDRLATCNLHDGRLTLWHPIRLQFSHVNTACSYDYKQADDVLLQFLDTSQQTNDETRLVK